MILQLCVLMALPKERGSIPRPHTAAHNYLSLQFQGTEQPHTGIRAGKTLMLRK